MRVLSVSFTVSKIYEWVDTMFLIKLGKRRFNPFSAKGEAFCLSLATPRPHLTSTTPHHTSTLVSASISLSLTTPQPHLTTPQP